MVCVQLHRGRKDVRLVARVVPQEPSELGRDPPPRGLSLGGLPRAAVLPIEVAEVAHPGGPDSEQP